MANFVSVPVSIGELCDKFTILQIKSERISDPLKLNNIHHELSYLQPLLTQYHIPIEIMKDLKQINETLWDVEDAIRLKEASHVFDDSFVQLARSVYIFNDQRFQLKSRINIMFQSNICEVKSYANY